MSSPRLPPAWRRYRVALEAALGAARGEEEFARQAACYGADAQTGKSLEEALSGSRALLPETGDAGQLAVEELPIVRVLSSREGELVVETAVAGAAAVAKLAVEADAARDLLREARALEVVKGVDGAAQMVMFGFERRTRARLLVTQPLGLVASALSELVGPIRDAEAIRQWTRALCNALQRVHARGLLHRDVTPRNVVFHGDALRRLPASSEREAAAQTLRELQPCLVDFGLARSPEAAAMAAEARGGLEGDLHYLSADAIRRGGARRAQDDLESLALVMYALSIGVAVYEALPMQVKPTLEALRASHDFLRELDADKAAK